MGDRIGEVLEGKYRLRRVLGRGGMGLVYEAEHTVISRRVAVKMLHGAHVGSDDMARRLLQEAKSASTIRHPNVIEIQDVGQAADGAIFIVMELLEGRSLSAVLSGEERLAPEHAVAVGRQILAGLQAAHAARIVHRDLKPDNVFLAREMSTGTPMQRVKILDFGISKGVAGGPEEGLTRPGDVLGTAWYMAPEQARGDPDLDERADIWAVGVMLYQMLVGRLPFPGDSYNAVLARILTDEVPSLAEQAPELDPALAAAVQKALSRDRNERFGSATQLDEALAPFAPGPEAPLSLPLAPEPECDAPGVDHAREATAETVAADGSTAETVAADVATAETRAADVATAETRAADVATAETRAAAGEVPFAPSVAPSPEPHRAPLWKRALWYAVTLPLLAPLVLIPLLKPTAMLHAFGLPAQLPNGVAMVVTLVLGSALGWCAVLVARAWQNSQPNRHLHGATVIATPALGLGLSMLHYLTLTGQKTSHQVSLRGYSAVTEIQARRMAQLIGDSHDQFLSAVAIDQFVLALLGVMLLIGWLFYPRDASGDQRSPARWLALPAGLGVIGLAYFVLFPRQLGFMGFAFYACYLLWILATVIVLRKGTAGWVGWAALATTLATSAAITGSQVASGYLALFGMVAQKSATALPPAEREAMFQTAVNPAMVRGVLLQWALLSTLVGLTWLFGRRGLPWPGRQARKPLLVFCAVFLITALPTPILLGAMSSASEQWAPHKFTQMQPVAPAGESEPTFYIDRTPQSLAPGHRLLYGALTRGNGRRKPTTDDLSKLLAGRQACPGILERTLRTDGPPEPARCVTAIEARLYCEGLGKRLPTPKEWDTALAKVKPGGSKGTTARVLTRATFGEWTMKKVHGTATFSIRGHTAGGDVPRRLAPNRFSKRVGFRCAFTFKGD